MRKLRKPSTAAVIAFVAVFVALSGSAIAAGAAEHVFGPGGTAPIYRTSGHTCWSGATDTFDPVGHFTADRSKNTVSGTVQLIGVAANADFAITVVENHPCLSHAVGTLHTDAHGNGSLGYSIGVRSVASVVWVITHRFEHTIASTSIPIG
jgi:hypothetical protein